MKIADMIISSIIKKGILYEARNCDLEFDVPYQQTTPMGESKDTTVKIRFKAEHMKISIEKE